MKEDGILSVPALRLALEKKSGTLEQRRRIEALLVRLQEPIAVPSRLRELRAIEVLERIGSADARNIVETLDTGDRDALLTREAGLALDRMRK